MRERKYMQGLYDLIVLLFCFLTLMISFSTLKPILSEPLTEINDYLLTALLMFDVKRLTLRIDPRRGKADDLYPLGTHSFRCGIRRLCYLGIDRKMISLHDIIIQLSAPQINSFTQ